MDAQTAPLASQGTVTRSFWLGKLFSLFGLVPIGLYVVIHLWQNLTSLQGPEAFNQYLEAKRQTPLIVPIMILIVWLPIAFHGLYGLLAIKAARPNVGRFRYMDNLRYLLQRVSGIGLLLFIPAHVYKTRLEPYFSGHPLDFGHMVEGFMGDPLTLPVYILGVTGACYHLANGIWQFSIGWGISQTEGGMRRVLAFSVVVGLVLLAMAYAAIYGFMRT